MKSIQPGQNPQALTLGPDGRLRVHRDGKTVAVSLNRCFPWTEPRRFLSLRDDQDRELAIIDDPAELDASSRDALETAMREAAFVFEIEKVLEIEDEFELRSWKVLTRQGPRRFQTRLDQWPRQVPGGALLIRDLAGDLYCVRAPGKLDEKSRKLLWAYVD